MGTCLLNRKAGGEIRKEKMAGSEKKKELKKKKFTIKARLGRITLINRTQNFSPLNIKRQYRLVRTIQIRKADQTS